MACTPPTPPKSLSPQKVEESVLTQWWIHHDVKDHVVFEPRRDSPPPPSKPSAPTNTPELRSVEKPLVNDDTDFQIDYE